MYLRPKKFFEVAALVKECIWTRVYKSGNSTSDAQGTRVASGA
jgi:hypothetical protein